VTYCRVVVYLDAASAEPLHPLAREALLAAVGDGWADPARLHREGRQAGLLLDQARERVATVLGCRADEISFTGSGTQAVQLAVLGTARARRSAARGPGHVVVTAVEHSSVLNAAEWLRRDGVAVTVAGVDQTGRADPSEFAAALAHPHTVLACLQAANQEVGTLQPVPELAEACQRARVPLFVDAAAGAGRVPVPPGWSLLAASAHKWGGPAGVGVLAVRKGVRWRAPLPADDRESRRAAGFPNVPAIVAASVALDAFNSERNALADALRALAAEIRTELPRLVPDLVVHGDPVRCLPHVVTFSCLYVDGEALVTELDRAGFSVSSGSACASQEQRPSHVLEAMGVLTHGNVRVSLPRDVTQQAVRDFLAAVPPVVARLRDTMRNPEAAPGPDDPRRPDGPHLEVLA
jgi:cysteine desulfurase